ncbi:hypothetical protein D5086_025488 [Populus alba]|uniref:Uncharacterized protein n=1 Tax=Populus alba TaxID=43335 RepID=A0ACC4B071_POPAL
MKGREETSEVWRAEIILEKKGDGELLGNIEWRDVVHNMHFEKVANWVSFFKCLALTLPCFRITLLPLVTGN